MCLVAPFGLQLLLNHLMNDIFRDILDIHVACYIDDICSSSLTLMTILL